MSSEMACNKANTIEIHSVPNFFECLCTLIYIDLMGQHLDML